MLASQGEAVVIDPQRDVDVYLNAAREHGLRIRHIFETHLHADFVSGHKELAARTGAKIYIGPNAGATVPHVEVRDGFELRVGKMRITVLETPGHTPESVCLVVTDESTSADPWAVLSGDTLFLGDVGRPDLSKLTLPQCWRECSTTACITNCSSSPTMCLSTPPWCRFSMRAQDARGALSTIRTERLTNYALQIGSREEFIRH
jgi:hydroxyacylglutathione hydrolase